MTRILYIKLLNVIFIPYQAVMYAGEQPRVRANRHLYSRVQNPKPSRMSSEEKIKASLVKWFFSNRIT